MPEPHDWTDAALLGLDRRPIAPAAVARPLDVALLDRDGTLNVHRPGYVDDPDDLHLLDGAAEAVRALNDAGVVTVVVTNQRGLSTGRLTRDQLLAVHRRLVEELHRRTGARLDGIQVCPHDEVACSCRKPRPGLVLQALERASWARADRCVLIGDQPSDLAAARAAGVPGVAVTGSGGLRLAVASVLNGP